ncbi:hypothetical protein ACFL6Q_06435 [Candidatus Neomarinimicrobiota bacterium]
MKEKVIAILTQEREKYSGEGAGKLDHAKWEEFIFERLAPYMRIEFPKARVEALLTALQSPDDFDQALKQILTQLKQMWEGERRVGEERRSEAIQRIELESGKFIWHDVDHTECGYERRVGKDRRN